MKKTKSHHFILAIAICFLGLVSSGYSATFVINNVDDAGIGFNDPTVVAPVGGNPGTTIGEQRLNVLARVGEIWGSILPSNINIVVQATFQDRGFTPCNANGAVLAAAGSILVSSDFANAFWPDTWYTTALANKLADVDLNPGPSDPGFLEPPNADDIITLINPNLGQPDCLNGSPWYYGFDNTEPAGQVDLLNTLLHELGHGLGFANQITETDGELLGGQPDVFLNYQKDNTSGKHWNQMTDLERIHSASNTGNLIWNGTLVTSEVPFEFDFPLELIVTNPPAISGDYTFGTGSVGIPPTVQNSVGTLVLVDDGGGPGTATDGCEPLVNAAQVDGNIAILDRGLCGFAVKVANAEAAGATAVIIVNNNNGPAFGPGGSGGGIPAVGISTADGDILKANLPVTIFLQTEYGARSGADPTNHALLFAPNPIALGSTASHWDTSATPNALMEPSINADLGGATTVDLTDDLMNDIGWDGTLHCPDGSDQSATVIVNGCDSLVQNTIGPYTIFPKPNRNEFAGNVTGGCSIADTLNTCSGSSNFEDCIKRVTKALMRADVITKQQSKDIQACAE